MAVRDGLVVLKGSHRKKVVEEWRPAAQRPTHELAAAGGLLHFQVTMTAAKGELDRTGSVAITGAPVDNAISATFGRSLPPGLYAFPDGLRLRVEQIANCDFDTSVPCFGGTYRATALVGGQEAHVDWRTKTTKLLRYTLTLGNFPFVVRK